MASALQVASLFAVLELKDNFTGNLQNAQNALTQFGKGATQLRDVGSNLSALTAPLLKFGKDGIDTASKFETAMAEIEARTGLTGDALENIRQTALKLGADTVFSAQDAADAFLNLLASGQNTSEALATLKPVMDAAAASGEGLGKSADAVTNILASWQLPASEAADVVDLLARGAAASKASMSSLRMGFSSIGPVAREFGLSVEDAVAILAVFEQNGIKGAKAGTQLRSMLTNMNRPTDTVQNTWKKLGVSLFDATGKARPLAEVMRDLSRITENMSDAERTSTLYNLAGSWGQMGLSALTATISMEKMKQNMADSASIGDVVAAKTSTFAFAIESLQGSIESLQINALTPLMDNTFRPMVVEITRIVNSISAWVVANPELATTIAQVATAIIGAGGLMLGIGQLAITVGRLGTAFFGLMASLAPLIPPLVIIGGIIAAYQTNFGGFRDWVDGIGKAFEGIPEPIRATAAAFLLLSIPLIPLATKGLLLTFSGGVTALSAAFGGLVLTLLPVIAPLVIIGGLIAAYQNNWGGFKTTVDNLGTSIRGLASDLGEKLKPALEKVAPLMRDVFMTSSTPKEQASRFLSNHPFPGTLNNTPFGTGSMGAMYANQRSGTRDSGGHVTGGKTYGVGVAELFVPASSGTAIPLDKMGGDTYNFNGPLMVGAVATPEDIQRGKEETVNMLIEAKRRARAN